MCQYPLNVGPACLLAEFHKEPRQLAGVVGLLTEGVAVTKTLAFEIDGVNLITPQPHIPVVAEDTLKNLFFELVHRGIVELKWGKNAVGIEARLKPRIDAVEVKKLYPFIHVKDVCVIYDVKAVRLMEGCRKFGKKAAC
jgi:hypothetical protein